MPKFSQVPLPHWDLSSFWLVFTAVQLMAHQHVTMLPALTPIASWWMGGAVRSAVSSTLLPRTEAWVLRLFQ